MVADTYHDYSTLKRAFIGSLGYCCRQDIPDDLIDALASFCDTHAGDMMMTYYASSLLKQFWRKRNAGRRDRFVQRMNAQMECKPALLALLTHLRHRDPVWFGDACYAIIPVWKAIRELPDGYGKANKFDFFAKFIDASEVDAAYQCALAMPDAFRTRALAGLFPRLDTQAQADTLSYLFSELGRQSWEASAQLRRLFAALDPGARRAFVDRFLAVPGLTEHDLAYFVIHNGQHIERRDARDIADRLRGFASEYLKVRSLLKLAQHLPEEEIGTMCNEFMAAFGARPASSELIHNLYHVSVFAALPSAGVVTLALGKIAQLDDSQSSLWDQQKYNLLSFLAPHLEPEHQEAAFAIAQQVKGGYRRSLLARLRRALATPGKGFAARAISIVH